MFSLLKRCECEFITKKYVRCFVKIGEAFDRELDEEETVTLRKLNVRRTNFIIFFLICDEMDVALSDTTTDTIYYFNGKLSECVVNLSHKTKMTRFSL